MGVAGCANRICHKPSLSKQDCICKNLPGLKQIVFIKKQIGRVDELSHNAKGKLSLTEVAQVITLI
jgi:hypothetical protein